MKISNNGDIAKRMAIIQQMQEQKQSTKRFESQAGLDVRPTPFGSSDPYSGYRINDPPTPYGGTAPSSAQFSGFAPNSFGAAPMPTSFGSPGQQNVQSMFDTMNQFGEHLRKLNDVIKPIVDQYSRPGFGAGGSAWGNDDTQPYSPAPFGSRSRRRSQIDNDDGDGWTSRMFGGIRESFNNPSNLMGLAFAGAALRPIAGAMSAYQDSVFERGAMLGQMGVGGSDLMGSSPFGAMMRQNAQRESALTNASQQAYMAYGGLMGAMNAPGGAFGAAVGIGAPALMAGQLAGSLIPGIGPAVALGMAGYGAVSYASNAASDWGGQAQAIASMRQGQNPIQTSLNNFGGSLGLAINTGRYFLPGAMSEDQRTQFEGMPDFTTAAGQFGGGLITRGQLQAQLPSGFTMGNAMGYVTDSFIKRQSEAGVNESASLDMLGFWNRVNPDRFPMQSQIAATNELYYRGVNPSQINPFMSAVAASQGQNPLDPAVTSQMASGVISDLLRQQNPQQYMERGTALSNYFAPINQARRLAGMGNIDALSFMGTPFESDLNMQGAFAREQSSMLSMRMNNRDFYDTFGDMYAAAEGEIFKGNYEPAMRLTGNCGNRIADMMSRYRTYGATRDEMRTGLAPMFGLTDEQFNMTEAAGTGDPYAIGALGRATGNQAMMQVDPEWQRQYQFNFQQLQRNIGFTTQTGFAPGTARLDSQGRAVGGDNLQYLASAFQSAGLPFQAGTEQGLWQIQDSQTAIQRAQQQFGFDQQARQLQMSQNQFNMSGQQFYESYGLSQRQFSENSTFATASMNLGRTRQVAQQQWQEQDLSHSRNAWEMQSAWSLEDSDRAIRFSRGRERLDLLRQRDRNVISQSLQAGQFDRQEERLNQSKGWSDEEFELRKSHHEQGLKFAREALEMQKNHWEQNRQFSEQQLEMQRQAFEKQKTWYSEQITLEDQMRLLTRQAAILQNEQATAFNTNVNNAATTIATLTTNVTALGEAASLFQQHVSSIQQTPQSAGQITSGLGAGSGTVLNNILAQLTKIAAQPNIQAQINMQAKDSDRISVGDLQRSAYTTTRNSR